MVGAAVGSSSVEVGRGRVEGPVALLLLLDWVDDWELVVEADEADEDEDEDEADVEEAEDTDAVLAAMLKGADSP